MSTHFRITSAVVFALSLLSLGCGDTETEQSQIDPHVTPVNLEEIPSGILTLDNQEPASNASDDINQSLAMLQSTDHLSNRVATVATEELPIQPGAMYGDGDDYKAMMVLEERPFDLDGLYTDPTVNQGYKDLMDAEVKLTPDDYAGVYFWSGPGVPGYEEVINSMPKEDPTYLTPEQREAQRKLVEVDVTEQYLNYRHHSNESNEMLNDARAIPRNRSNRKDAAEPEKIPNIREYIRAKRAGDQ